MYAAAIRFNNDLLYDFKRELSFAKCLFETLNH